jgi:hypothetical protein
MGYHSLDHLDLRKAGEAEINKECLAVLPGLKAEGFSPEAFAWPYGFYTAALNKRLFQSFKILRGFGTRLRVYTSDEVEQGFIIAKSIDNISYKKDADFYTTMNSMLLCLAFMGDDTILPLNTHKISADADWGITPKRLEWLLERSNQLGLHFYLYRDFFE